MRGVQAKRTRTTPARARGDRGAVLVEAAIASMLFITALFGVMEFGLAFFDYLTTANMTRDGARTGSTLATDPLADYQILQKIATAGSGMPTSRIQFIVVYKATGFGAAPTAGCLTGSVANTCNYYTAADLTKASSQFGCGSGKPDNSWCPTTRKTAASAASSNGPPDYLGVYIKVIHPNITSMFGASYTFTDSTVIRMEAQTP